MNGSKRTRVIVAPNVGEGMGGEAIKALQYFRHLHDTGQAVALIAHARSRQQLGGLADYPGVFFIEDGLFQKVLWRMKFLSRGLSVVFHLAAARQIRRLFRPEACLIHYLCPISPVELRFPPKGYDFVLGPLNEHVGWPPAFRQSEGWRAVLDRLLRTPAQMTLGILSGEKRRAQAVLVSGGDETEASLRTAGARSDRMRHVVDSGVSDLFFAARRPHDGDNGRFVAIGRFVPYKGFDLALEALARTPEGVTLDIYGGGPEKKRLEAILRDLKLEHRVRFLGWLDNGAFAARVQDYRGLVFPTLAEANGIVMQEAMAAGVPVITLRWGGPARLARDDAAAFVEVGDRAAVIDGLAREMTSLAQDPARAERIAAAARTMAEKKFRWNAVAMAWEAEDLV